MAAMNHDLSDAELAALRCAASGLSVVETAHTLYKGSETIKTQLTRARLKLGARNTTHAVALALADGQLAA